MDGDREFQAGRRRTQDGSGGGPMTSWSWLRLGTGLVSRMCRRICGPAVVGMRLAGALLAAILGLGLRVNLSPSAPRGRSTTSSARANRSLPPSAAQSQFGRCSAR